MRNVVPFILALLATNSASAENLQESADAIYVKATIGLDGTVTVDDVTLSTSPPG